MIKKTLLLLIFFTTLNSTVYAQATRVQIPIEYFRNQLRDGDLPPNVTGSPYDNDKFQLGKVSIKNNPPYSAMLRYDGYRDNIEIQNGEKTATLFKRDYITAVINDEKFVIASYKSGNDEVKQGYFVELTDGNIRLLKKKYKRFMAAKESTSTYQKDKPARLVDEVDYYIQKNDEFAKPVKLRKKNVLKALNEYEEAGAIVKKRRLNLSEEKDCIELITLLNNASDLSN